MYRGYGGRGGGRGGYGGGRSGRGGRGGGPAHPADMAEVIEIPGVGSNCHSLFIHGEDVYAGFDDSSVKKISMRNGAVLVDVKADSKANRLLVDPGGMFLFVGMDNGTVRQTSLNPEVPVDDVISGHRGPISVMLLHGKVLVTAAGTDLARWAFNDAEMKYHKQPQVVNTGDVILCGALLENFLFLGNRAGDLLVYDLSQPELVQVQRITKAHRGALTALAVFPGGVLTGCVDGFVKLWAPATPPQPGTIVNTTAAHLHKPKPGAPGRTVYELQVSMDGAGQPAVVVCFERSPGSIMELPGLSLRGKLQGVMSPRALSCLPSMGLVAMGGQQGSIRVWRWLEGGAQR